MQNILEYSKLKNSLKQMDFWFDAFLKGKGKKLDDEDVDSDLCREYNSKYQEYLKLSQKIRLMEHK